MKRWVKKSLNKLYIFGDLAGFWLASLLAILLRFGLEIDYPLIKWYFPAFLLIGLSTIFLMYSYKLYKMDFKSFLPQLPVMAKALFYSLLLFFLFTFFIRAFSYSRLAFFYFTTFSFLGLCFFRRLTHLFIIRLYLKGIGIKKLIVVGINDNSMEVINFLIGHPEFGYQILGALDNKEGKASFLPPKVPYLGPVEDLIENINNLDVDTVLISLTDKATIRRITCYCEANRLQILLIPDLLDLMAAPVQVNTISSIPLISFKESPLYGDQGKIKRVIDIIISLLGLILLSPLFLLVVILIKLDDKGPAFFKQERMGMNGKRIAIWKFRTMVVKAEERLKRLLQENPALAEEYSKNLKLKDDPRITKCGKFLRRSSIDELPQLINVIKGEMSLVGPRPYLEREFENELSCCQHYKNFILLVPPGITGLWQVSGRNDKSPEERVKIDIYYINNWSFWLDIIILLKTIPVILAKKGAY